MNGKDGVMKIELKILKCTKEVDGWTEDTNQNDAEKIEIELKTWRHKVELTYFKKERKLRSVFGHPHVAGLFKETPFKSGDHEKAVKAIEEELNKQNNIPDIVNVKVNF